MAVSPDVTAAAAALDRCALSLRGRASETRLTQLGVALKPVMVGAFNLGGNRSFSGWTRNAPIDLDVAFQVHRDKQGITMHFTRKSAGPGRVAEDGRQAGMSRGVKGGARRRKAGSARNSAYTTSVARGPRRVGAMKGKGVWTAAESVAARRAPSLLTELTVRDVEKAFGGR